METLPVDSWVVNVIDHFLPRQLMAYHDLASRIHVRNAPESGQTRPT
jgi:hypothetical protein